MSVKRRSYDIYDIEERLYKIEKGGLTPEPTTWNYSTDETDTHQKWIDGTPVYNRVFHWSTPLKYQSDYFDTNIDCTGLNIIDITVIGKDKAQYGYGNTNAWAWKFDSNNKLLISSTVGADVSDIIIKYYKTAPAKSSRSKKA